MLVKTEITGKRSFFYIYVPCTIRTTSSQYRSSPPRITSIHVTAELLYSTLAGTCKKNASPTWLAFISDTDSSDNCDPLKTQTIAPVVTLQLKVAVDPSVALIDVGVLTNSEM